MHVFSQNDLIEIVATPKFVCLLCAALQHYHVPPIKRR